MLAVPHTPVVLAGPAVQSVLAQQPAVATHLVVIGQFLKPGSQLIPQAPVAALHTAAPFDAGAAQLLQPRPQKLVLVLGWHTPLQLCIPVSHIPLHGVALGMQAPLHSLNPFAQVVHRPAPVQVKFPPHDAAAGATQAPLAQAPAATRLPFTQLAGEQPAVVG